MGVIKHGYTKDKIEHPIYSVWKSMKVRCYNMNRKQYKDYGGRGIEVCEEWRDSPHTFVVWSEQNGYKDGLSIDRKDNNKDYEPNNCHWVDRKTQNRNQRSNRLITYKNKTQCMSEWAEEIGMSYSTFKSRVYLGWSIERVIETPLRGRKI